MNHWRRYLTAFFVIVLILVLVLGPPFLGGLLDLSQAESLRDESPGLAALEYESAARRLPWRPDLWEQAGLMALAGGDPAQAVHYLGQSSRLSPTGRLALGDAFFRQGDVSAALVQWERLRDDGLGTAQVFNRLGHVYYDQERYEDAVVAFDMATRQNGLDSDSHYMMGLLLATRSPEESLDHLILAAQLDPTLDPVIQGLRHGLNVALLASSQAAQLTGAGRALAAAGAWTLAMEAFQNATVKEPGFAEAWAWLGQAKQVLGLGGQSEIDQALTLDPNSAEIRGLRAVFYLRENRFEDARAEFEAAANIDPLNPGWQVALGDAIARTGDVPEGLTHYQRAIELSPRSADYWRALANFTVDYNYGVQDVGFPAALQARALAPDDPQNAITLGRIYFANGNLAVAEMIWDEVVESNPDIPSVHLYLGVLHLQKGNNDSAYQHLVRARDLDPGGPYGIQAGRVLDQYFP